MGGFGIGLALVTKICQLHDVAIKVYSIEKEGTQFKLFFRRDTINKMKV